MSSFPIQLKRNGTAAATPSSLLHGEVALNYADGKLFWKDASNVIRSFTFQAYAASSHTHAASDITSGTLDAARIANDSITYAKLQNVSATDRLLGRSSAGAGDVEEITCTAFGRSLIDDADAAAARTTLSVQPTASPAFTGTVSAAAANFTGAVSVTSPLTLTGTVAGNVRQIKMQTSGVDRWQITPSFDAETGSNAGSNFHITRWSDAGSFMGTPLYITRSTGVVNCESGLTIVSGQLLVTTGSVSAPGVAFSGDTNTGLAQIGGADTASLVTAGVERVRVGSGGRVQFFANSEKFGVQLNNGSTGNGPFIGSDGADILTISTSGGAERLRVKSTGSVRFVPLSADPSTGNEAGDVYYNSSTNKLRVYNGTSWVDLH